MNKIYRVVFNNSTGTWVVASEHAKGRTKPASHRASGIAASVLVTGLIACAGSVSAQTVALPTFDPTINDNRVGSTVVSGGANVTLQGPATQIIPGITGRTVISLADLFAAGLTTDPRANPDDPASLVVNIGSRSQIVTVRDPITQGTRTVAVYVNSNMIDTHATSIAVPYTVNTNAATG